VAAESATAAAMRTSAVLGAHGNSKSSGETDNRGKAVHADILRLFRRSARAFPDCLQLRFRDSMILVSRRAKARSTGSPAKRNSRSRILLTVLVALAMLLILLRLAEFASHRIRHAAPHVAPAALTRQSRDSTSETKSEPNHDRSRGHGLVRPQVRPPDRVQPSRAIIVARAYACRLSQGQAPISIA
jgi:hypothetical protein